MRTFCVAVAVSNGGKGGRGCSIVDMVEFSSERSHLWRKELHPAQALVELPVGPAASAIEAVAAKRFVDIGREPCSSTARRPEPCFRKAHECVADAHTLVLRQYGDDPEFARGPVGHAESDQLIGVGA